MNEQPVRIGVVGVNYGATVHIPGLQSEGCQVVAVCSQREERAGETAEKFGIPHAFTDYDAMLRMEGLDAIAIASPVPLHHPMTMAALAANKHVLCEKPFTMDQQLAREMWDKAQSTGLTAMIGHEFRYSSARMYAKELINDGYIGNLRLCLMRLVMGGFGGNRPRPAGAPPVVPSARPPSGSASSGFLWGIGSHYIDCLRHWFGEVSSVSGHVTNFTAPRAEADDTFLFTLEFANGGYAQMVGSRAASFGPAPAVEIYGDAGTLVTPQRGLNPPAHGTVLAAKVGDEKLQDLPVPDRLQPFVDERDDRLMPFRLLVRDFIRGVREGSSPAPNLYDGWRCQQILDAVRESSRTGRRIAIPPD